MCAPPFFEQNGMIPTLIVACLALIVKPESRQKHNNELSVAACAGGDNLIGADLESWPIALLLLVNGYWSSLGCRQAVAQIVLV
jgi:hypothetical protein